MQLKLSNKKNASGEAEAPADVSVEHYQTKSKGEGPVGLDISGTGLAAARVSDGRLRTASITGLEPGMITDGEITDPARLGARSRSSSPPTACPRRCASASPARAS